MLQEKQRDVQYSGVERIATPLVCTYRESWHKLAIMVTLRLRYLETINCMEEQESKILI